MFINHNILRMVLVSCLWLVGHASHAETYSHCTTPSLSRMHEQRIPFTFKEGFTMINSGNYPTNVTHRFRLDRNFIELSRSEFPGKSALAISTEDQFTISAIAPTEIEIESLHSGAKYQMTFNELVFHLMDDPVLDIGKGAELFPEIADFDKAPFCGELELIPASYDENLDSDTLPGSTAL